MKKYALPLLMIFLNSVVFAQTPAESFPYPKSITVEGSAEMEIIPDEIYTTVVLKEYEKKGTGKITLEKIKADFLQMCKSIGLPDSTVSIDSYEGLNHYRDRRRRGKELYSSITYQIKFSTSTKMDELVAKLDDDATQNFEIVRTSHSKIREYRKQLKVQAVKAAKEKAIYLSEAIDEKIGVAINIIEPADYYTSLDNNNNNFNYRFSQQVANGLSADESRTAVDFKKMKLRYTANVVFALK